MPSPLLESTHCRTSSGVAYCNRLMAAYMVKRHWAWHEIISLGGQTRSNDVRRDMPSPPLGSTHDRMTSGVACHHIPWTANTVERRQRDMPSPPLDSPHGRTTSSVAFHYRLWAAHTVEQRLAWHAIIAFRKHKRSNDVGRGMTSPP